jgi:hypothetical protein
MNINIATKDDLMALKTQIVEELFELLQKANQKKESREWLKTYEVMQLFNISKGTLHRFRTTGKLSFYRMGKCIYYRYSELIAVMDQNKINHSMPVGRGRNRFRME